MRRLLFIGSAVVFLDVVFYAAITPLLPGYVDDLGLSKTSAGVLSAAYAAGTLVASLPAGFMAAQVGPRRTLVAGLVLLGVASLIFGFATHIVLLDIARFVQGVAGALAWAGVITWLIVTAPESRRGAVIGDVMAVAIAGALFGPAVGALAHVVGAEPVFSSVLVVAVGLAVLAMRMPLPGRGERVRVRDTAEAIARRPVLRATAFVMAPSVLFGVMAVLIPLRINHLGGGAGVVAAGFMAGAAFEATLSAWIGRVSDRVGRARPYVVGMIISAAGLALLPAGQVLGVVLALLIVMSVGAGLCFAPAMAMLSDAAGVNSLHQGLAAGLINIAWAAGQVLGSVGGGATATVAGDALPCLVVAALLVVTALAAWQNGVGRAGYVARA
ncbi:MAG TPA: MFS transporter [Solirubrobacterales bacterium]|nr:MFS transporter [Solirubrobacterales bacterium]